MEKPCECKIHVATVLTKIEKEKKRNVKCFQTRELVIQLSVTSKFVKATKFILYRLKS